jgi:hypothetical protein
MVQYSTNYAPLIFVIIFLAEKEMDIAKNNQNKQFAHRLIHEPNFLQIEPKVRQDLYWSGLLGALKFFWHEKTASFVSEQTQPIKVPSNFRCGLQKVQFVKKSMRILRTFHRKFYNNYFIPVL